MSEVFTIQKFFEMNGKKMPKPLKVPVGQYIGCMSDFEFGHTKKNETPFMYFKFTLIKALNDDVQAGNPQAWENRKVDYRFWPTQKSMDLGIAWRNMQAFFDKYPEYDQDVEKIANQMLEDIPNLPKNDLKLLYQVNVIQEIMNPNEEESEDNLISKARSIKCLSNDDLEAILSE